MEKQQKQVERRKGRIGKAHQREEEKKKKKRVKNRGGEKGDYIDGWLQLELTSAGMIH